MKRSQKTFALPALVCLLWTVLAACGSKPSEPVNQTPTADVRPPQHEEMVQRGSNQPAATLSEPGNITIPAGQTISIRTTEAVDTDHSQLGQTFRAKLSEPITLAGQLIVPLGTPSSLVLSKAGGDLELRLATVMYHGQALPISTARPLPGKSIHIESGTEIKFQTAAPLVLPR